MTNQKVLGKQRVNEKLLELAMSISNSNDLPATAVPELMALFGEFLAQQKNNLVKPLEDENGKGITKSNSFIDSMRASSPTRTRNTSENHDQTHWKVIYLNFGRGFTDFSATTSLCLPLYLSKKTVSQFLFMKIVLELPKVREFKVRGFFLIFL